MNKITKIIASLLASTALTFSAFAGEMTVTGTAKATYGTVSGQANGDNGVGVANELKFSAGLLSNLLNEVDKIEVPSFPFNGKYLKEQGLTEGKEIGFILKELEKEWLEKDFNLEANEAVSIINKVKKSSVLNF